MRVASRAGTQNLKSRAACHPRCHEVRFLGRDGRAPHGLCALSHLFETCASMTWSLAFLRRHHVLGLEFRYVFTFSLPRSLTKLNWGTCPCSSQLVHSAADIRGQRLTIVPVAPHCAEVWSFCMFCSVVHSSHGQLLWTQGGYGPHDLRNHHARLFHGSALAHHLCLSRIHTSSLLPPQQSKRRLFLPPTACPWTSLREG